jgi:hypothetical protein
VLIMMMKRWMAAAVLFAMSAGALADGTYEFDTITNVSINGASFSGVLVNDTVPTTLSVTTTPDRCFSWMQLMMTHPGTLTLSVTLYTYPPSGGFPASTVVSTCQLSAKP